MIEDITESEPFTPFARWLASAENSEELAETMTLATATAAGVPSLRAVLLKGVDARGFVFYTNLESRKSNDLFVNPHAAARPTAIPAALRIATSRITSHTTLPREAPRAMRMPISRVLRPAV